MAPLLMVETPLALTLNGDSADGKGAAEISLLLMAPKVPSNDTQILLLVFPMVPLNYQ
jgi:hypothetical protein